jgi:hypothetical protein
MILPSAFFPSKVPAGRPLLAADSSTGTEPGTSAVRRQRFVLESMSTGLTTYSEERPEDAPDFSLEEIDRVAAEYR